ncbi:hypothetical protein WA026_015606 [Henosepilachna vigintioctopunctata]|uniref:Uncharacterized protein n=1 Tax=Henosepilachna vigintioctopunctata TaxID=420089 RepID=A0AAW1V7G0_9CUCU
MYNVRSKQQSVKNKKSQDIHSFKSCKLNCSCSANSKFKRNQSDNRFNAKSDPWIQSNKDNDRLLRDELKRYGLDARKLTDSKYKQSCPGHEKCCINVKNTPHICIMQREHHDQPKLKSKTDSNLTFESYVIELKNEIKAQREDIPSLPRKYKQKYLNSIKEELLLNKVASEHEDSKKVKELIREIQVYRANKGTPFVDSMKSATVKSNNVQTGECKDPERCRKNNCKAFSECGSVKGGKGRKIKKRSSNRHKLQGR